MSDIQPTDALFEYDFFEWMLNTSSGPQDRLDKLIRRVANQPNDMAVKLGFELEDVRTLRRWLDTLVTQRDRSRPQYKKLLTTLQDELDDQTIMRVPIIDIANRRLAFRSSVALKSDTAGFALIVAESFNSDLHKRIGKCEECQRHIDNVSARGKPVDPNIGPYFIRSGRGDNRKHCTDTHRNAVRTRAYRDRKKLQQEAQQ